jgi:hypothetical protein
MALHGQQTAAVTVGDIAENELATELRHYKMKTKETVSQTLFQIWNQI